MRAPKTTSAPLRAPRPRHSKLLAHEPQVLLMRAQGASFADIATGLSGHHPYAGTAASSVRALLAARSRAIRGYEDLLKAVRRMKPRHMAGWFQRRLTPYVGEILEMRARGVGFTAIARQLKGRPGLEDGVTLESVAGITRDVIAYVHEIDPRIRILPPKQIPRALQPRQKDVAPSPCPPAAAGSAPAMGRTHHLLFRLAEECAEVAQRASKAAVFGLTEVEPGQSLDNAKRILGEYADLVAILEMLVEDGALPATKVSRAAVVAKKAKVERFLEYSRQCGRLAG